MKNICSSVLMPRGTVCLFHSEKNSLCHCLVFRITWYLNIITFSTAEVIRRCHTI